MNQFSLWASYSSERWHRSEDFLWMEIFRDAGKILCIVVSLSTLIGGGRGQLKLCMYGVGVFLVYGRELIPNEIIRRL